MKPEGHRESSLPDIKRIGPLIFSTCIRAGGVVESSMSLANVSGLFLNVQADFDILAESQHPGNTA